MRNAARLVFAVGLFAVAFSAQAALVTWTLHQAIFEDGGTATGFFVVDTERIGLPGSLADFDITTTSGISGFAGNRYFAFKQLGDPEFPFTSEGGVQSSKGGNPSPPYLGDGVILSGGLHGPTLQLWFPTNALGDISSGTFPLLLGPDLGYNSSAEFHWPDTSRRLAMGTVSAIPEPAAIALLGFGIGLLMFLQAVARVRTP